MNKKLLITLIIVFIIAGGLFGLYLARQQQDPNGERSFWGNFFGGTQAPQNNHDDDQSFPNDDEVNATSTPEIAPVSLLDKPGITMLANGYVGGASFASDNTIRYAMRDTGNLFSFDITSGETERYSNIIIPAIYHAQFSIDGNTALTSSNERGVVLHAVLTTVGSSTEDVILSDVLENPQLSPDGTRFAYLEETSSGGRIRIRSLTKKVPDSTAYTSVLRDITYSWATNSALLVHNKASYLKDGVAILVNASTGAVTELGLPDAGLTALVNTDASRALIGSVGADGELIISAFDNGSITTLPVNTLPEKCAWSRVSEDVVYCAVPISPSSKTLPDSWWKGEVSFTDEIWKFDLRLGSAVRIWENTYMDMVELMVSSKDELLMFRNKKNASLWALNLEL